ncbi:unnamed protein product [Rotaria sp. Silwood1]|nr:unnamed protein product [Rotaria sp. Silwood1]CAF3388418.1 unnamed protein product [Rotaria sp. Silwood1]CAF3412949.1 unnamed protein product [Rotaria sp. Silwood1]CAF3413304.1 unnamed protein product [Rotaria sp. Silwood1]CAF4590481.1 unnamed protein product [Rotaria sp. Silwood1]
MMLFVGFLLISLVLANKTDEDRMNLPSSIINCTVKHGIHLLNEGEKIIIHGKLYKVEDCHLQRAYRACGPDLWYIVNIVCEAIDLHKEKTNLGTRIRKFVQQKLLTEACCESSCTVVEMSRYCPS